MFEQLAAEQVVRVSAPLTSTFRQRFDVFDRRGGSIAVVVSWTGRTVGSLTATLRASWDGGNNYDTALVTGSSTNASGAIYLLPSGTIPPDLRVVVEPAGGFDGSVKVALRAAGLTRRLD